MDSGLLGKASSDPIVVLDVMGTSHKSTQKKKELNPVWLESFSWPVEDDEAILEDTLWWSRGLRGACNAPRVHLTSISWVTPASL